MQIPAGTDTLLSAMNNLSLSTIITNKMPIPKPTTIHIDVNHDIATPTARRTYPSDVSLHVGHFHRGWFGQITQPPSTTSPRSAASIKPSPGYP